MTTTTVHTPEPVYTAQQIAEHLGISKATAYAMVRNGEIRAVHVGRRVRIPASALDDFLSGKSPSAA